jgi:hypothetical protein
MILSFALITIIHDLDSPSAQTYLKTDEAIKEDSPIRKVIECGLIGLGDLELAKVAKLIFAALVLSGQTLMVFKGAMKTLRESD